VIRYEYGVKRETFQRVATPTGILVGLAEPLATACAGGLSAGGLRVLRVGHIAAACERIPVTMPQLVVVPTSLHKADREELTDRCVAVGAELHEIPPDADAARTAAMLKEAANAALVRALRSRA